MIRETELKRCVSRSYDLESLIYRQYTNSAILAGQDRQRMQKELLALAPGELHVALVPVLRELFFRKEARLELNADDYGGDGNLAILAGKLGEAWKGVAEVDTEIDNSDDVAVFKLYFRAV
jgi:hypothetical protein